MSSSTLDRRRFLELGLGSSAGAALTPRWLEAAARAPSGVAGEGRRLVVLELFGGNDGLNTLVPFEDDAYHRARPAIGLDPARLLRLDELSALHPSLGRTRGWFERGHVAIVRDVGYAEPNLSHFTSRDIWSTASTASLLPERGWLGGWAEREAEGDELALLAVGSDAAPRLVRGELRRAPAVPDLAGYRFDRALSDPNEEREDRARLKAFEALVRAPGADPEAAYAADMVELARRTSARLSSAARGERPVDYPDTRIGHDLAAVADVIAAGLSTRVFHVVHKGFDTHTRQLTTHARLLNQLDAALDAFLHDLRAQGRFEDTLVLTISEFGRRVAENGIGDEAGSDHGAASVQFLVGGRVRPGLVGAPPDLENLDADGNLVARVDFRSTLATVLEDWLAVDPYALLGTAFPRLPLLETA